MVGCWSLVVGSVEGEMVEGVEMGKMVELVEGVEVVGGCWSLVVGGGGEMVEVVEVVEMVEMVEVVEVEFGI